MTLTWTDTSSGGWDMAPRIDPRAKILAALTLIAAIALTPPMGLAEFGLVMAFVAVATALFEVPVGPLIARSLLVLPFAGAIALFAPLAHLQGWSSEALILTYISGWPMIFAILSKAFLSVLVVSALVATTSMPELLRGLRALGMPDIMLGLLTFLMRYTALFREQVNAMRIAIASRAPTLRGWHLLVLYGSLGGNLFVRAYERGEQVYAAMLARGYTGTLPAPGPLFWRGADSLFVGVGVAFALAILFYP
jgi:cobalt/nickel transport system permease protein